MSGIASGLLPPNVIGIPLITERRGGGSALGSHVGSGLISTPGEIIKPPPALGNGGRGPGVQLPTRAEATSLWDLGSDGFGPWCLCKESAEGRRSARLLCSLPVSHRAAVLPKSCHLESSAPRKPCLNPALLQPASLCVSSPKTLSSAPSLPAPQPELKSPVFKGGNCDRCIHSARGHRGRRSERCPGPRAVAHPGCLLCTCPARLALPQTRESYSSSASSNRRSSPARIPSFSSRAIGPGFVISGESSGLSHSLLLNKTKRVQCIRGVRSMVRLFSLQKARFHGLNHIQEISTICTCNKDTGEAGDGGRGQTLKSSAPCLECVATNYLICIYLETCISKTDGTGFDLRTREGVCGPTCRAAEAGSLEPTGARRRSCWVFSGPSVWGPVTSFAK